jgi:hypothetical protein
VLARGAARHCEGKLIHETNAVSVLLAAGNSARRSGMIDHEHDARLKDCLTTVHHLEEENRQLRRAAVSFGQLAERLNEQRGHERRVAERDRRRDSRDSPERRNQTQHR